MEWLVNRAGGGRRRRTATEERLEREIQEERANRAAEQSQMRDELQRLQTVCGKVIDCIQAVFNVFSIPSFFEGAFRNTGLFPFLLM